MWNSDLRLYKLIFLTASVDSFLVDYFCACCHFHLLCLWLVSISNVVALWTNVNDSLNLYQIFVFIVLKKDLNSVSFDLWCWLYWSCGSGAWLDKMAYDKTWLPVSLDVSHFHTKYLSPESTYFLPLKS